MAGPITWQNIAAPSFSDASMGIARAQQSLNSGFDSFNNVIKQQTEADNANWDQIKKNNTDAFMNKLLSTTTAEQFTALRDSGDLQRMLEANGAQIDQAAARSALDQRLGTLQQRDTAAIQYKNTMLDEAQAADVRRIGMLTLTDPNAAAAELAAKPELRAAVQLAQGIDARNEVVKNRGRDDWRFGQDQVEAKRKDWRYGQEQLEAPIKLEGLKLGNTAKKASITASNTANAVSSLNLKNLQRADVDAEEARRLEAVLAAKQQQYLKDRDTTALNMGSLAKQLGLPTASNGAPNFEAFDKKQVEAFDVAAKALNLPGMPTATDFMTGDTKAANAFYQGLVDSGQFKATTLQKFKSSIRNSFDSNANGGSVGNDARNLAVASAMNQVKFDELDANNWYAPNSPNALRNYDTLAVEVDKMFGPNEREDLPFVQQYLSELATKGVKVKNKEGKEITVVPSKNDILGAVRGTYEGWNFFNTGRKKDIQKAVEKSVLNAIDSKRLVDSEDSAVFRRQQAVQKILNSDK